MSSLRTALLLALGIGVSLAIAEVVSRWLVPDGYFVYPPGTQRVFEPLPELIPGVAGPGRLSINALGIRGDPFSETQRFRLLAVGGSTTICIYLDDREAWPHLLQEHLDGALGAGGAWVGNVGAPGHTTVQHAIQVPKLLRQHPEIDGVILLVGVNDLLIQLGVTLDREAAARMLRDRDPGALLESAFSLFPGRDADAPWYWRTGIGRLWATRRGLLVGWEGNAPVLDPAGQHIARWRAYRKQASALREVLPDLSAALAEYAANLNRILDAAAKEGARVILLTQPALWRGDLSAAERDLLWTGGPPLDRVGPGAEYYSVGALAEGMRRYNARLLQVCRERGAECLDLAQQIPRTTDVFWDDVHFTEEGARRVADRVAAYLLEHASLLARRGTGGRSGARISVEAGIP